jgi:hypothetical protein
MVDTARRFCVKCGRPLVPGAAFCVGCGARAVAPMPAINPASGGAQSVAAAYGTAARAVDIGTKAVGLVSLPWQSIVTGQSVDVQGMLRAAAPTLIAMAPRPNLRRPALAIAFTLVMQIGMAVISGGAVSVPMLVMSLLTGGATAVLGLITGGKGGALRKVTGIVAVGSGVVQLVSLVVADYQAIATPVTLLTLLPSVIAVVSGLVLAISTAIAGFRK